MFQNQGWSSWRSRVSCMQFGAAPPPPHASLTTMMVVFVLNLLLLLLLLLWLWLWLLLLLLFMVVVDFVDFIPHTVKQLSHTVKIPWFHPSLPVKKLLCWASFLGRKSHCPDWGHMRWSNAVAQSTKVYIGPCSSPNDKIPLARHVFCCCFSSVFFSKITTKISTTVFAFVVHIYCPRSQPPPPAEWSWSKVGW